MATDTSRSPRSERRAQLIREMARDLNRTRPLSRSSKCSNGPADTTGSDFDPDNEAIMSTRQVDNLSQRLPDLRASARKYDRYKRPEPDYAIDTSAMEKAFPDFTQGGTSSSDNSISIELGRGGSKAQNGKSWKLSSHAGENSMDFSPAMIGNYQVMSTPPVGGHNNSVKASTSSTNALRRDAQLRGASLIQSIPTEQSQPVAKAADYGSGESRQGSIEKQRTLTSMHARVNNEDTGSFVSDGRPPTVNLTKQSTRFGGAVNDKLPTSNNFPAKFTSKQGLFKAMGTTISQQQKFSSQHYNSTVSSVNPGTQQSFVLPDMSELVSGIFQDGTPVFSKLSKPRASRFASGTYAQSQSIPVPEYAGYESIPVPEDEQAIFVSLRLLQDKVAELENAKAEAQANIQDLQERNRLLEQEKNENKRFKGRDSALGTTDGSDGGDDTFRGPRKWIIEKTRLESVIRSLQAQVELAEKNNRVTGITIKNLTQERASAVSQLGVAYVTTKQLKADNERLMAENTQLRSQLASFVGGASSGTNGSKSPEDRLNKTPQFENYAEEQFDLGRKVGIVQKNAEKSLLPKEREARNGDVHEEQEPLVNKNTKPHILHYSTETSKKGAGRRKTKKTRVVLEEYSDSESSEGAFDQSVIGQENLPTGTQKPGKSRAGDDATKDLTFLSLIDNREIAQLRKTLEEERIARKHRRSFGVRSTQATGESTTPEVVDATTASQKPALPRKSSLKDLTGRTSRNGDNTIRTQTDIDQTIQSNISTVNPRRRHSDHSLLEQRAQRRGLAMEDMTSAFILPDITMRTDNAAPKLSTAPQQDLEGLAEHDGQNCTVCKRVIQHGTTHNHDETGKQTIRIPKPIPVSERMAESTPFEEEPTIRPSQPPPIALATVIKGIEDELAHLKIQLSHYQALYNQHDPSLSKRKRKSVFSTIEKLMQAIDTKSDQVYSLYDVLEGQKAAGQEMNEEQFEITLQSIGLDLGGLGLRGGGLEEEVEENGEDGQKKRPSWDLESSDSEGDLPWEGFENTGDLTGKSGESRRRSWGL